MFALASFSTGLPLAFMDMLGGSELLVIFLLVLVFFGGEKMPDFARGLGKAIREFRKAASGVEAEFKKALEEDQTANKPTYTPPPYTAPTTPSILPPPPSAEPALEGEVDSTDLPPPPPPSAPATPASAAPAAVAPAAGTPAPAAAAQPRSPDHTSELDAG